PTYRGSRWSRRGLDQGLDQQVDLAAGILLSEGKEQGALEACLIVEERNASQHVAFDQPLAQLGGRQRGVDQELVVERARREQLEAWQCSDAFGSVGGFRVRLAGDVTQTGWPLQREVRRDGDGQQRLAGEGVGGRLC